MVSYTVSIGYLWDVPLRRKENEMNKLELVCSADVKAPVLRWHCQVCGGPIDDAYPGYVVMYSILDGRVDYPGDDVRCRVMHCRCDPDTTGVATYWMPCDELGLNGDLQDYLHEVVAPLTELDWCDRVTTYRLLDLWFEHRKEQP